MTDRISDTPEAPKPMSAEEEAEVRRDLDPFDAYQYGGSVDRCKRLLATLDALRAEHRPSVEDDFFGPWHRTVNENFGWDFEQRQCRVCGGDELRPDDPAWSNRGHQGDCPVARLYAPARSPIPAGSLDVEPSISVQRIARALVFRRYGVHVEEANPADIDDAIAIVTEYHRLGADRTEEPR